MNNGLDNSLWAQGKLANLNRGNLDKVTNGLMHIHKIWPPSRTANLMIVNAWIGFPTTFLWHNLHDIPSHVFTPTAFPSETDNIHPSICIDVLQWQWAFKLMYGTPCLPIYCSIVFKYFGMQSQGQSYCLKFKFSLSLLSLPCHRTGKSQLLLAWWNFISTCLSLQKSESPLRQLKSYRVFLRWILNDGPQLLSRNWHK